MNIERDYTARLLAWFDRHGRHDLPWQHPRTPYRVWLSEIMLQQTQVATVIPYFLRFIERFPTLPDLAAASTDDVMAHWAGLGYYARARNLHAAAKACVNAHDGELPRDIEALHALPGIGRSTAGAILSQAWNDRFAILDGNVKRVLARFHGIAGWPGLPAVEKQLWALAEQHLRDVPDGRQADYTQAQMDFGATLCTRARPACAVCPLQDDCVARREGLVDALPTSKPSKQLPEREATALWLENPAGDRHLGLVVDTAAGRYRCGHARLVRAGGEGRLRRGRDAAGGGAHLQPLPPVPAAAAAAQGRPARAGARQ